MKLKEVNVEKKLSGAYVFFFKWVYLTFHIHKQKYINTENKPTIKRTKPQKKEILPTQECKSNT